MAKRFIRHFSIFVLLAILLVPQLMMQTGCANMIPPAGGPRDSIGPVLLESKPLDSSRNFKDKRIVFTFDEYVDIQNTQEEVLVSPIPAIMPAIDYKLNTVTVRLKDSLEPNTTYKIEFGNSIKDINESNPVKNFTYVFSTGEFIDSLTFSGNVLIAETGKVDSTLIVMLHSKSDDSVVTKEKPRYVTKLDPLGKFTFKNLPPKKYYLYALKDEGGGYRYQDEQQLFAFADSAIVIGADTKPVTLYAYTVPQEEKPVTTPVSGIGVGRNRGGINNNNADRRLKFSTNIVNNQHDLLNDLIFTFEQPIRVFDTTKVGFFTDSTYVPVTGARWLQDSNTRKVRLIHEWKENTDYHLILDKEFAEDSTGKKLLRTDTIDFRTKRLADYGKLKLRIRNLDFDNHPVLQFVLNNEVVKSYPLTSQDFENNLFAPGEYELRILYDKNQNGKWDPGSFFVNRQQPELVKPIERRINVKASWGNEFEIAL